MIYVFENSKTGEIIRRDHDALTKGQMREYIREGYKLYIQTAPAEPLVKIR